MDPALLIPIGVIVVLVIALALYFWVSYHSLMALQQRVDEGWADIAAQLKRRAELVPALAEAVRRYATHERAVFASLDRARDESVAAQSPEDASAAENHMQQALKSVFSVAEAFPKLQASPAFLGLQAELVDAQDRIQSSRRFYNGGVREFNSKLHVIPNTLFAKRAGIDDRDFFEAGDVAAIAEPPRVQF